MADETKDTSVKTEAVLTGAASIAAPQVVLTAEDIVKQLNVYKANANASLAKIQENIEKVTEQLNGLNRMRLMILGQREVVNDLFARATGTTTDNKEASNG